MSNITAILQSLPREKPVYLTQSNPYSKDGVIDSTIEKNPKNLDAPIHQGFALLRNFSNPDLMKQHMASYGKQCAELIRNFEQEGAKVGLALSPEGCVRPLQELLKNLPDTTQIPRVYASRVGQYGSNYTIDIWTEQFKEILEADILFMPEDLIDTGGTLQKTRETLYSLNFKGKLLILPTAVKLTAHAYQSTYVGNPLYLPNTWLVSGPGFDGSNGGYKLGELGLMGEVLERNANVVLAHRFQDPTKAKANFNVEKHVESLLYNREFTNYSDILNLISSQEYKVHKEIADQKSKTTKFGAQGYGEVIENYLFKQTSEM